MRESFTEESKLLECDEKKSRGNADFSCQEMSNSGIVKRKFMHEPRVKVVLFRQFGSLSFPHAKL